MPKLTIDGTEIEVAPGTSIFQAAESLGIEIPRFCYHDRLSVPANCRMCLVEVAPGPPKPQASCALACADGMTVKTDSEMVKKARKGVMEMLLINHPLDCPICDQGGECDLQDQAVAYGFDRSRYYESKRAVLDKELGPLVKTVMTRCIQCTRCVRFSDEIAGTPDLGLYNRGEDVEIGPFIEKACATEMSGNLVDICPVGALTSKPYAFSARPWELRKTETIDVMDAVGCNIRVDSRGAEVMRVLPRLHEGINEEWINDRTRHAVDGLKKARLDRPWIRDEKSGKLREATWEEALSLIAARLSPLTGPEIGALAGDLCDLESMVALKDLMGALGSGNLDCRTDGGQFDASTRAGYIFNSGIAAIEQADCILLVGTNPRVEATLVNTRIRKAWLNNRVPIGVIGESSDLTYPYTRVGAGPREMESLLRGTNAFADRLEKAERPLMILGAGAFLRADGAAVQALAHDLAERFGVVREGWNGFNVLQLAASRVGALDIGFLPSGGAMDIHAMLEGTRNGRIKALYLLGVDEFDMRAATGWKTFVVYQGHHGDAGAARADVILPGAAYTEKDGLYVNTEGRVQAARRAVFPPGQAREDWAILRALSEVLGKTLPYDSLDSIRSR
ncbi:MAG TPA: NADH-quinone oxidoreductase subunit NuoG, partial [Alphaproteobacteria bacterium]|nr:NADH-quinone oxidoreductase subunit NuoG [Alphaproteobacteria bacterium]